MAPKRFFYAGFAVTVKEVKVMLFEFSELITGGDSSEKSERSGEGEFRRHFQSKGITILMPFFFDNFCRLLGFWGTSPPVPHRDAATGNELNLMNSKTKFSEFGDPNLRKTCTADH